MAAKSSAHIRTRPTYPTARSTIGVSTSCANRRNASTSAPHVYGLLFADGEAADQKSCQCRRVA
jgi:hypothetical protein